MKRLWGWKYLLTPLLFNIVLKSHSFTKTEEEIKIVRMDKEEIKLSLPADGIAYVKNMKLHKSF